MIDAADAPLYPIGAVTNALTILDMFRDTPTVRSADAAQQLGVARSTAHRILTMLEHYGFVTQQEATKVYEAGPALLNIGLRALRDADIIEIARPHLNELRNVTGETCGLTLLDGRDVVVVAVVNGTRSLRVVEDVGTRLPAHLTSPGKAMLARLSTAELRKLYPERRIEPSTERSVKTREELEAALDEVRRLGYGTNLGESADDVVGIGAAIEHRNGTTVGAVALVLPTSRMTDDLGAMYGDVIVQTAERIGAELP